MLVSTLCLTVLSDLSASDDVVHPLLFACETKSPVIVKIALSALQKLIQFKAVPQVKGGWGGYGIRE